MVKELSNSKGFLIDGYPREKAQGELFEQNVSLKKIFKLVHNGLLLFIDSLTRMKKQLFITSC